MFQTPEEAFAKAKHWWEHRRWPKDRWPNFTPRELRCKGDNLLAVDEDALDRLQALRTLLSRPLVITSAYRSPEYNRRIGGAPRSQHMLARAFDIVMTGHDRTLFERAAREAGFSGFGFYPDSNFIHIDTGPARQWGERW